MRTVEVRDLKSGTICRRLGWWGVLGVWRGSRRAFDRWDTHGVWLYPEDLVEVPERRRKRDAA